MITNPYFYLALIALFIKIWASYRLRQNKSIVGAGLCLVFLSITYLQTVIEMYGYYAVSSDINTASLLPHFRFYYLCVAAFVTLMPLVFLTIIHGRLNLKSCFFGIIGMVFISAVVLHPTLMITGIKKLTYTYTRVPGEYYWIFTSYCILLLSITFYALVKTYRQAEDEFTRVKSANLLITFIPVALTVQAVIVLMMLGLNVNAIGFLPVLLSTLVLGMAENLRKDGIVDLRVLIPGTRKFALCVKALKPLTKPARCSKAKEHYLKEYEKILMEVADAQFETTKEKMEFLKKSKTSYYRVLKELSNNK